MSEDNVAKNVEVKDWKAVSDGVDDMKAVLADTERKWKEREQYFRSREVSVLSVSGLHDGGDNSNHSSGVKRGVKSSDCWNDSDRALPSKLSLWRMWKPEQCRTEVLRKLWKTSPSGCCMSKCGTRM